MYKLADVGQKNVPTWTSCRYTLAYIGMGAFTFQYLLRFNLSVAVVCMVKPPSLSNNLLLNASFENNSTFSTTEDNGQIENPCGSFESSTSGYSEMVTVTHIQLEWTYLVQLFYGFSLGNSCITRKGTRR